MIGAHAANEVRQAYQALNATPDTRTIAAAQVAEVLAPLTSTLHRLRHEGHPVPFGHVVVAGMFDGGFFALAAERLVARDLPGVLILKGDQNLLSAAIARDYELTYHPRT
jgi:hypothetical protein